MKLLVVEDDARTAALLVRGLQQAGYSVDHAVDGIEGLAMANDRAYAVAVVDIMLPGMDGLAMVERLREQGKKVPVIFLSAKRSLDDRIRGLRGGGDDYLTKPFSFSELLARLQSLLRRVSGTKEATHYACEDLTLERLQRVASRGGKKLDLQPKEFALLELLFLHAGKPVSKTLILEQIWDYHFDPQTNVVDVLVSRLRAKVDRPESKKLIQTLRGVGYALKRP